MYIKQFFQKYNRLKFTTMVLHDCFIETIIRPAVLPQLGWLLAALLQLSHAPLMKPTNTTSSILEPQPEFEMTIELYAKLKRDQEEFKQKLLSLISNCPQSIMVKELMVIHGMKNCPKWLRLHVKKYLTNTIVQPNGIVSLILAICDEVSDLGAHWNQLDVAARLVAAAHGNYPEKYYDSVCLQVCIATGSIHQTIDK